MGCAKQGGGGCDGRRWWSLLQGVCVEELGVKRSCGDWEWWCQRWQWLRVPHGFWVPDHRAGKSQGPYGTGGGIITLLMYSVGLRVHGDHWPDPIGLVNVLCPVKWHGHPIRGVIISWVCICALLPRGLLVRLSSHLTLWRGHSHCFWCGVGSLCRDFCWWICHGE